jgi:lipopolysaccharide/colanic/teichoic acid biosynthesis glycosyltransferase
MKRSLDIVLAGLGLIVLAPLLAAIGFVIKVMSPGPVFYRGVRIGRNGLPFRIFKFRTMVIDAERRGGSATAADDPRLTKAGAALRRFKLDELPQLINVLLGDMSFVGPRPEVEKYVRAYSPAENRILLRRPGITDWASIWNSDEGAVLAGSTDPEGDYERFILPTKLRLQIYYADNHSVWIDLKIVLHTLIRIAYPRWTPRELAPYGNAVDFARSARHAEVRSRNLSHSHRQGNAL